MPASSSTRPPHTVAPRCPCAHLRFAGFHANARSRLRPPDHFLQASAFAPKPVCREDSTQDVPQEAAAAAVRRGVWQRGGVSRALAAPAATRGAQAVLGVFDFTPPCAKMPLGTAPTSNPRPAFAGRLLPPTAPAVPALGLNPRPLRGGGSCAWCPTPTSIPRRCFNPRPCAGRLPQIRSMTSTPLGRSPVSTCTA